jgi:transcriptional regulator with XRE-family HTH domain
VHPQRGTRHVPIQTDKSDTGTGCPVTTLEDLGRYLQRLRESRHVTQESLSAKTEAITGDKINRSRISEIENARRDRITERELRVYMLALKCTHDHINQIVNAVRKRTRSPQRESPVDSASTNSVMPNFYPAGLSGAEDDLTLEAEKSENARRAGEDDPKAGGEKENYPERSLQEEKSAGYLDTSQPQVLRRRWRRHLIQFATGIAMVLVGTLTAHGAESFLGQENMHPPTSSGTTAILFVPHDSAPVPKDTLDLSKNVPVSDREPVRIEGKWSAKESELQRGAVVDTASRGGNTQQVIKRCCAGDRERRGVDPVELRPTAWDRQSYADLWQSKYDSKQLATDVMR